MKHTKINCLHCQVELSDSNWYESRKKAGIKVCKSCWSLQNKSRLTIQGKRVQLGNKLHPYHKLYKTKGMVAAYEAMGFLTFQDSTNNLDFIKKESIAMFDKISYGEVYIMTNPAWKGWIKVGMAIDSKDRLKSYQTSSPLRDYKLEYYKKFNDRRQAETIAHERCSNIATDKNSEWFKMKTKDAIKLIKNITEEQNERETA